MALILLCIIATTVEGLAADDDELSRETLKGLQGVYVIIEYMVPVAEKDGLTKDLLQTDVELQLRKSGIKVLTKEEWTKTPWMPYLYVRVSLFKKEGLQLYAFFIEVKLRQAVYLKRNPDISTLTETWDTAFIGTVGVSKMKTGIRDSLKDKVDEFINAYLAVNPK